MQEITNPSGVVIPPAAVEDSNRKKKNSKKTLAQLPVYRAAANLKFIVTTLMAASPRKLAKFFDQMLGTAAEIKKSVGMASISRNPDERAWYLDCGCVLVQDLSDDFTALRRLPVPVIGRDEENKVKSLVKSINSQLVAWRDYTMNEGVGSFEPERRG